MKPSADFTVFDLEATGLDSRTHEILEIGAVRVTSDLQQVIGEFEYKILPIHIERAMPESLEVNGYSKSAWSKGILLRPALQRFLEFMRGSILAAYNNVFDMSFLIAAVRNEQLELTADYHYFDIFSIAHEDAIRHGNNHGLTLEEMCVAHQIPPPPTPHKALQDAKTALAVLKAIRARYR